MTEKSPKNKLNQHEMYVYKHLTALRYFHEILRLRQEVRAEADASVKKKRFLNLAGHKIIGKYVASILQQA